MQMQPLSADQMDDLDDVIHIDASGTVTSIENNLPSFIIHGTQYVAGGQRNDDIALRAELQNNPKWSDPLERLPKPRAIVSVFGPLRSFDNFCRSDNQNIKCFVVNVQDITYLFAPPREPASKSATKHASQEKKKTELQTRFKARHGRKQESSQPSPSSSQVQLGKRKENSSEDEVNERV